MYRLLATIAVLLFAGFANAQTLKIATIAPEASEWMRGMKAGAKEIGERTDGRVQIKLYGGGVQGSDDQVLRKMRIGQLQGGSFTPQVLKDRYKDIILYTLPMVFNDAGEAAYVRERFDERLRKGLDDAGFVSFGFAGTGFSIILSHEPVHGVDDLKNKKVWVPQGDGVSESALKALGLNPAPLALSDVYTGLQTGLIDIVPGSAIGALVLQWHTAVDYLTELPLVYTVALTAIEKKAFEKLQPGDQEIVTEVMTRLYAEYDAKSAADDAAATQALLNAGVERIVPNDEEAAEIRRIVLESNREMAEQGEFSIELYDEMLSAIDCYRNVVACQEGDADKQGNDVSKADEPGADDNAASVGVDSAVGE